MGCFVQANFGSLRDLTISGVAVGRKLILSGFAGEEKQRAEEQHSALVESIDDHGQGSIIVILATDAPLLPYQLERLCRRAPIGLSRVGCAGHHLSGDIILAFSTQSPTPSSPVPPEPPIKLLPAPSANTVQSIDEGGMNAFFYAAVDVVEEAVLNALCAGTDEVGNGGYSVKGFPHDQFKRISKRSDRVSRKQN